MVIFIFESIFQFFSIIFNYLNNLQNGQISITTFNEFYE